MTIRSNLEVLEKEYLHPKAKKSSESLGRKIFEDKCEIRTDFQRDRDRIIHCKSFRRLKHKTQVFLSPSGDHYRTRLTHTLEVSQIARTIAKGLRLNEDLVEAISLGHDLGHTPFGHAGEKVLSEIMGKDFRHYEHSVKVVESIERGGKGLNLTFEVIDGIKKHSKGKGPIFDKSKLASTLEGQIVRLADIIAYVNHDLDDSLRAGLIDYKKIPERTINKIGSSHSERVSRLVKNVIESTINMDYQFIAMSDEMLSEINFLRDFLFENVYEKDIIKNEFDKACNMLYAVYKHFDFNFNMVPDEYLFINNGDKVAAICDYIAGMTDRYAMEVFSEIYIPKRWW
ncbi:MAG: deoxyguanosinetriphosphate triphosphohydrolase [Calditerrivibrio sp.]|nr:deoxyguanosinetriphosphate triphosphohydrolase [Calditerrivibrio sp.]MCA1932239.1 deoxyguanosinetriphosphate triphosphohydrolase [Calditerrivibrio sp.]